MRSGELGEVQLSGFEVCGTRWWGWRGVVVPGKELIDKAAVRGSWGFWVEAWRTISRRNEYEVESVLKKATLQYK